MIEKSISLGNNIFSFGCLWMKLKTELQMILQMTKFIAFNIKKENQFVDNLDYIFDQNVNYWLK